MQLQHSRHAQLFAGEFRLSSVGVREGEASEQYVLTPTGLFAREAVIVGVLLERWYRGVRLTGARVADPTGAFELLLGERISLANEELEGITPPAFVAISGRLQIFGKGSASRGVVYPSRVCSTSKEARDSWVLRTAVLTLRRIEAMSEAIRSGYGEPHTMEAIRLYNPSRERLMELALMAREALACIADTRSQSHRADAGDPKGVLLELMRGHGKGEVIEVEGLISEAEAQGIAPQDARRALLELLEEGECYSPRKGFVKLL